MSNYLPKSYTDDIFKVLQNNLEEKLPFHQEKKDINPDLKKPFTIGLIKKLELRENELRKIIKEKGVRSVPLLLQESIKISSTLRNNKDKVLALFETKNLFKNENFKKTITYSICNLNGLKYWFAPLTYQSKDNPIVENDEVENDEKFLTLYIYFQKINSSNSYMSRYESVMDFILTIPSSNFRNLILKGLIEYYTKNLNGFNPQRQLISGLENLKQKNQEVLPQHQSLDLSNSKDINKIRFLIELGVIDNLNSNGFSHSTNSLSSAISGVTGIDITTVQPYLNAYLNDKSSKNNPMNITKKVEKIKNTLNQLGFNKT